MKTCTALVLFVNVLATFQFWSNAVLLSRLSLVEPEGYSKSMLIRSYRSFVTNFKQLLIFFDS